jgi:hypothetical protein
MSHDRRLPHVFLFIAAVMAAGCAEESVTAPTTSPVGAVRAAGSDPLQARALAGSYQLSFVDSNLQPIATLPVCTQLSCEELILQAHVDDGAGSPAQSGSVTFQYCSYKGLPPNDITRADEAPSSACADGSAMWQNLGSASVNASGNAYLDFGGVRIPRTIGFRFKYSSQHSGIASGTSAPQDFTWTAA